MTTIGYARGSTDGQSLAAQDATLREAGCAKVYAEKVSGAKTDRAALAKALAALADGDCLIVTSSIGWRDQRGISSTPSMQSARQAQASSRSVIAGQTQPRHTES